MKFIIATVVVGIGFALSSLRSVSEDEPRSKTKLIYVYDALCGWCYGFSSSIKELEEKHSEKYDITIVSGGLRVGDQTGTINEIAPFIKKAYKDVEKTTGVKYGEKFVQGNLKSGELRINSLPPAIALCIVKELKPEKALAFTRLLHEGIYVENNQPDDLKWYAEAAEKIGINGSEFTAKMGEQKYTELAYADFAYAKTLGVNGFPVILRRAGANWEIATQGYTTYTELLDALNP